MLKETCLLEMTSGMATAISPSTCVFEHHPKCKTRWKSLEKEGISAPKHNHRLVIPCPVSMVSLVANSGYPKYPLPLLWWLGPTSFSPGDFGNVNSTADQPVSHLHSLVPYFCKWLSDFREMSSDSMIRKGSLSFLWDTSELVEHFAPGRNMEMIPVLVTGFAGPTLNVLSPWCF
jgi:hypothetical protein